MRRSNDLQGAGHFVPMDRAGPALQMMYNFIWNTGDYSHEFHSRPPSTAALPLTTRITEQPSTTMAPNGSIAFVI